MATVGELIDRTYRDYLEQTDDQGVTLASGSAYTTAATSIVYTATTMAPDEEDLLAPGVLVEHGIEQMRVTDVDSDTNTMTVERGVNGTTATAIAAGDEIRVAPIYSRRSVFDAVCDNVVALYPDLSATLTQTITSATTPVDVSADIVAVKGATYLSASRPVQASVELLRNYPPSATGQAVLFHGGVPTGTTVYLTYEARFARPDAEADDVTLLGVDAAWERIVVVGAAAQVLAGRDLDAVSAEFLTEQLEREGFPVSSAGRLRDGLLRYQAFLLEQARSSARANRITPIVMQL